MLSTRNRLVVCSALVLELGIAGYAAGHGTRWLLLAILSATLVDTCWGLLLSHRLGELAGIEIAVVLAVLMAKGTDPVMTGMVAAACAAWLLRDRGQPATGTA
jgi:hypothetical protein